MRITLKLYATLGQFLPEGATRNQIALDVADGASVAQVLKSHNVPMERCHLILVNGHYTPPAAAGRTALDEGDHLAVWPPIAGG